MDDSIFEQRERRQKELTKEEKKMFLKKGLKSLGVGTKKVFNSIFPPKTAEQIAYEKQLKEESEKAYKKEYLKQSIKQSKKKARMMAQQKFNPQMQKDKKAKNQQILDNLMKL